MEYDDGIDSRLEPENSRQVFYEIALLSQCIKLTCWSRSYERREIGKARLFFSFYC